MSKPDRHPPLCREQHVVLRRNDHRLNQGIVVSQIDRDDSTLQGTLIGRKRCLFHNAVFRSHDQKAFVIEFADGNATTYAITFGERQKVDQCPAFAGSILKWQIVNLLPQHFAFVREKQQPGMGTCYEQVFDRVFVIRFCPDNSLAAPVLSLIRV